MQEHKTRLQDILSYKEHSKLSLATSDEYDACLDIWVDAFAAEKPNDLFVWMVDDDAIDDRERTRRMRLQMRFMLMYVTRPLVSRGLTVCVRDSRGHITAAAALSPPGTQNAKSIYDIPWRVANLVACGLPPSLTNMWKWGVIPERKLTAYNAVEEAGSRLVQKVGPAWYLQSIGVSPELRGTGQGSLILGALCAFADETRSLLYLDCSEALVCLYTRFGFQTEECVELKVDGCSKSMPQYIMLRKPNE